MHPEPSFRRRRAMKTSMVLESRSNPWGIDAFGEFALRDDAPTVMHQGGKHAKFVAGEIYFRAVVGSTFPSADREQAGRSEVRG